MLFRSILGQGGTEEDPKINRNMKQAKKSKREDGQLEKTCFFQRRRFFVKNGGLNGSRITNVFLKTIAKNRPKNGTTKKQEKTRNYQIFIKKTTFLKPVSANGTVITVV